LIESLPFAAAMRDNALLYGAVEIAHLLGIIVLVGSVLAFDLRVLGLSKAIPVRALARHTLPWSVAALLIVVPSGLKMFAAKAEEILNNPAFRLKMGLLLVAGLLAAFFHTGPYMSVKAWDTNAPAPLLARACVALSLVLWIAIVACGRLIAYF
jgi:uncharacterized membrane protein